MLTKIEAEFGEIAAPLALTFPILGITPKDSLLVRKITGLDPPAIGLFIGDYSQDGGIYQGRRVGNRNVVLTIELNPNPALGETASSLRELLYKTFVDPLVEADYVKLNLHMADGTARYVVGYTEKFETDIFSSDLLAQISLICPDPYIRDSNSTWLVSLSGWNSVPVVYKGTAETGFEVEIFPTTTSSKLTLDLNGETMVVNDSFATSQVVYVSTVRGKRSVKIALATDWQAWITANPNPIGGGRQNLSIAWDALTELGQAYSLLPSLSNTSPWLELHSQSNVLRTYSDLSGLLPDGNFAIKTMTYLGSYWGI